MTSPFNGAAKWVSIFFGSAAMLTLIVGMVSSHTTVVARVDSLYLRDSDQSDILEKLMTEQVRQGRILERVAAKVGADPN